MRAIINSFETCEILPTNDYRYFPTTVVFKCKQAIEIKSNNNGRSCFVFLPSSTFIHTYVCMYARVLAQPPFCPGTARASQKVRMKANYCIKFIYRYDEYSIFPFPSPQEDDCVPLVELLFNFSVVSRAVNLMCLFSRSRSRELC